MVVAFDDLIYRRSAVRLTTIVSTWLIVPGGLALLYLTAGYQPEVKLFPVTVWSVIGGLLLGIGAVVGGACTGGVVARIGSGEYVFLLTIVGFAAGCVVAQAFGPAATIHAAAAPTTVAPHHPVVALAGLLHSSFGGGLRGCLCGRGFLSGGLFRHGGNLGISPRIDTR